MLALQESFFFVIFFVFYHSRAPLLCRCNGDVPLENWRQQAAQFSISCQGPDAACGRTAGGSLAVTDAGLAGVTAGAFG